MQRSALEICRANGLPEGTRFLMLPASYRLAWWAVATKWLGAALLAWYGTILIAVVALVIAFLATAIIPVPHRLFLSAFEARLQALGSTADPSLSSLLEAVRRAAGQLRL